MFLRRTILSTILGTLFALPAQAGPLLFTFEGTLPVLNVTTIVTTSVTGVGSTTVTTPSVSLNVPVSGSMTFDSDVWALVGPPFSPTFPLRQFTVTDPSGPFGGTGVETPELIRGTLDVAGVGTLRFDRSLVDALPKPFADFPYQGTTTMSYMDGTEGLNVGPFEFGDAFLAAFSSGFGWFDVTASAPGDVFLRSETSSINIGVVSQYTNSFVLQNLFPAGPPVAFSFVDPVPGDCSQPADCADGLFSFGSFFAFSALGTVTADGGIGIDRTVTAPSIVVNRAQLQAVAAPEPASLALLALGAAMGIARRRQALR